MSPPSVWDQKCESVNVTVPQRECNTVEEAKVEMDCEVLEETSSTPVCMIMTVNMNMIKMIPVILLNLFDN